MCVKTYIGSECSLTDNAVENEQDACPDYINEEEQNITLSE
jgi:hypothetical protein